MRDAFGGAMFIKIMLVVLAVYIAFMASSLNYAKAFRVKNQIINIIEEFEGHSPEARQRIEDYIQHVSYYVQLDTSLNNQKRCTEYGYCITRTSGKRGTYYLVETFVELKLPFLGISLKVPVKGETRAFSYLTGVGEPEL